MGDYLRERGNRSSLFIATKGAHPRLESMHTPRMSRAEVENDLNLSLKALGVDTIDLYYLHRDDRNRSVEEILSMMEDFVKAGKVRQYACSNWRTDRMLEAHDCAVKHGYNGFAANQIFWNIGAHNSAGLPDTSCEMYTADMGSAFQHTGMVASAYSSQANGFFTKLAQGDPSYAKGARCIYDTAGNHRVFAKAKEAAEKTGRTVTEIVLSYIISQPNAIAVVGCKNMEQLTETMKAADRDIPTDILSDLENTIYNRGDN